MSWWRIKTDRPPDLPPSRTARMALRHLVFVYLILAAVVATAVLLYAQVGDLKDKYGQSQHGARQLYSQAVTAGASPVTTPAGAPPASQVNPKIGPQGERGPGPTSGQIADAVDAYCAVHEGCRGVPSRAQVQAAVRAFCAAGACRGPAGRTGSSGPSGARGPTGAAGPSPTSDQISDAVAAYCAAHGGCTGPAGPTGPKGDTGDRGAQGDPGVGIASIDCTGLGIDQLVVHYDDGRTQAIPCNAATPSSGAPS